MDKWPKVAGWLMHSLASLMPYYVVLSKGFLRYSWGLLVKGEGPMCNA